MIKIKVEINEIEIRERKSTKMKAGALKIINILDKYLAVLVEK